MPIARDISALKQRLDSYFWRNRSPEMSLLNAVLSERFSKFEGVAVVGGLARDFARKGRAGFRSDVDLVISAPAGEVSVVANNLNAEANRFGGYRAKVGIWKIDFWALEMTWAAQYAGVPVSHLKDITHCTFFDWDAIVYDLWNRKIFCDTDYLDRLRAEILDVNLRETPSLEGNLLRAMRRIVLWNVRSGPDLRAFIQDHLDNDILFRIQVKEAKLYPLAVSTMWPDAESAKQALLEGNKNGAQMKLDL